MSETIKLTEHGQIIGGIFSNCENAHKAVRAFQDLGILKKNLQIVVKQNDEEVEDTYTTLLLGRGFSGSQALYHNKVIREGKVLLAVYDVVDAAPVIDIFNQLGAEYNPNGKRNLRSDVTGMTVGAVVGATTGGVIGASLAGPAGAAAGAAVGAAVGGGSGALAGTAVEHKK